MKSPELPLSRLREIQDSNPYTDCRRDGMAGLTLFCAGAIIFMGIITGEIFYPAAYTTAFNDISDLGATRPPDSVSYQPSAGIFNGVMMVGGVLLLAGSVLLLRLRQSRPFLASFSLFSLCVLGVGLFPGNVAPVHSLFSLGLFLFGAVSALLTYLLTDSLFRYPAFLLGMISLGMLLAAVLVPEQIVPYLGSGGTERWVAYPVLLWLMGTGGVLIGGGLKKARP